jgi:hypothetical protein
VSLRITSELAFAEEGNGGPSASAGRYLRSAIAAQTDRLQVQGYRQEESYWERIQVGRVGGVEYVYDIYRSFSLGKGEYAEAKDNVLFAGRDLARNAKDLKAEKAIERLMERNSETTRVE